MTTAGERLEAKLDWCISALKYLLAQEAGVDLVDDDEWEFLAQEASPEPPDEEHIAVRTRPQPKCTHQHQVLDQESGAIRCAKCGHILNQSGVVHDPARHGNQVVRTEWGNGSLANSSL